MKKKIKEITIEELSVISRVTEIVAECANITPDELLQTKTDEMVAYRAMCYTILKEMFNYALTTIGSPFSKDHATVLWGIGAIHTYLMDVENAIIYQQACGRCEEDRETILKDARRKYLQEQVTRFQKELDLL